MGFSRIVKAEPWSEALFLDAGSSSRKPPGYLYNGNKTVCTQGAGYRCQNRFVGNAPCQSLPGKWAEFKFRSHRQTAVCGNPAWYWHLFSQSLRPGENLGNQARHYESFFTKPTIFLLSDQWDGNLSGNGSQALSNLSPSCGLMRHGQKRIPFPLPRRLIAF